MTTLSDRLTALGLAEVPGPLAGLAFGLKVDPEYAVERFRERMGREPRRFAVEHRTVVLAGEESDGVRRIRDVAHGADGVRVPGGDGVSGVVVAGDALTPRQMALWG